MKCGLKFFSPLFTGSFVMPENFGDSLRGRCGNNLLTQFALEEYEARLADKEERRSRSELQRKAEEDAMSISEKYGKKPRYS